MTLEFLRFCRNRNRDGKANRKNKTGLKRDWESPPQLFLENYGKTIKIKQVCEKSYFGFGSRLRVGKVLAPYRARPRAVPLIKNAKLMWFSKY